MSAAPSFVDSLETRAFRWELLGIHGIARGMVGWIRVLPSASQVLLIGRAPRVRIEETGKVSALSIVNEGAFPVLLPADLVLGGGLQTRCVDRTVIVAAGTTVTVPVRCVEKDRWCPRDAATKSSFTVNGRSSMAMRQKLGSARASSYQKTGTLMTEQSMVWNEVDAECMRTHSGTATRSYEGYLTHVRARHLDSAGRSGVVAPAGATGAVILTGDGETVELHPSSDALGAATREIVADLFDPSTPPLLGERTVQRGLAKVEEAIRTVWRARASVLEPVAGAAGDYRVMLGDGVTGNVALLDGALAFGSALVHRV